MLKDVVAEYDFHKGLDGMEVDCRFSEFFDDGRLYKKRKGKITLALEDDGHPYIKVKAGDYVNGLGIPRSYTEEEKEKLVRSFLEEYGAEKRQAAGQERLFL